MSRTNIFRVAVSAALIAGSVQIAQAGFLAGFSGYSVFGTGSTSATANENADGTVNFAVYENTDGDWTDDFPFLGPAPDSGIIPGNISEELSGGGVDSSATYVFFYQVVNTDPLGPGEDTLDSFFVNFLGNPLSLVTGAGFIDQTVFNDGADISSANPGLGTGGGAAADVDSPVGDGTPSNDDVSGDAPTSPGFTTLLGALNDSDLVKISGNAIEFAFADGGDAILTGGRSPVLYITSNLPPLYNTGGLTDNGFTEGDIPIPNPEPGTFLMTFGALACGLVALVGAKRKSA